MRFFDRKPQPSAARIILFIVVVLAMLALLRGTGSITLLMGVFPKINFGGRNKPKTVEADPELDELIKNVKIECKAEDKDTFGVVPYSSREYDLVCKGMAAEIRANLKCAINSQVLKRVLKSEDHHIEIFPPNTPVNFYGAYNTHSNAVLVRWKDHPANPDLIASLPNELHHNAVCVQNFANPVFNGRGSCSVVSRYTYFMGWNTGVCKKAAYMRDEIFNEPGRCVVLPDAKAYGVALKEGYKKMTKYPQLVPPAQMKRKAQYEKGYNAFAMTSKSTLITEQVSDIDNLPPSLQKFFFPELCALLTKFHEVDDYCDRPVACNRL